MLIKIQTKGINSNGVCNMYGKLVINKRQVRETMVSATKRLKGTAEAFSNEQRGS